MLRPQNLWTTWIIFTCWLFVLSTFPVTSFASDTPAVASAHSTDLDQISSATQRFDVSRPVRIGVITLPDSMFTEHVLKETVERLEKAFSPIPIETMIMRSDVLEENIRNGQIDAFIASSGFFNRMRPHGVVNVGTLISVFAPDPNHSTASTFLVRADSTLRTLSDLKGSRASTSFPTAFISVRTGLAELAYNGYDPDTFFSKVFYTGGVDHLYITSLLDKGVADVALVTACWLETLPPQEQVKYRVINAQNDIMSCAHSTRTYPGITVGVTQGSEPGAAHLIAKTLLAMPKLTGGYHWGLATDMRAVDQLYRTLKIEQYSYLREWSVNRWLKTYWYWFVFIAMCIVGLLFHSWRSDRLVRERTQTLVDTMKEKQIAQKRADAFRERSETLQKATIVGQLSNMIAHELSQPLAAIKYYCDGQKALIASGNLDKTLLSTSLNGMESALERTRAIVEKVLSYNRGTSRRDSSVNLDEVLETAIVGLNPEQLDDVHISISGLHNVAIEADPLEIEVLFTNLLKNALEACLFDAKPEISIRTERHDGRIRITLENSGKTLTEEDVLRLQMPFMTSKTPGHGLGVSIAMAIAEASGGHMDFQKRDTGGLRVLLTLNEA